MSAWAKVVGRSVKKHDNKIGYIDLFAGPGLYEDGTKSTPILVLEHAIEDADMQEMLVSVFNDSDPESAQSLKNTINALPGISKLNYIPEINTEIVENKIAELYEQMSMIPCLTFLDPWGYKGLSDKLVKSIIKDWGCECIIFFNYNRINMGLGNPMVKEHMNAIFGEERANILRSELKPLNPPEREVAIIESLKQTLKDVGAKYIIPFRFRNTTRISHHLVFATKHPLGYEIMKTIMANESSEEYEGIPSFEYNPVEKSQLCMFPPPYRKTIDDLKAILLDSFCGQTLTVSEIYNKHSRDTLYIKSNYKNALLRLEKEEVITATPPSAQRREIQGITTLADWVVIKFPVKESDI